MNLNDPGASVQGPPKTCPKPTRPLRPDDPTGHGPFQCRYCGRYGQPGACEGCGAPNAPVSVNIPARRPDVIQALKAGVLTPNEARVALGMPTFPANRIVKCYGSLVPAFDTVKR